MGEHRHATGRLARNRHVLRIAAELLDVVPNPAQRRLLIHQAVVAGRATGPRGERRVGKEAKRAQAVVDRDDDDSGRREFRSVVVAAGVLGEAAAVDPYEHRPLSVATQARREHVEVEAVLREGTRPRKPARRLRAARRVLRRVTNALPRSREPRRPPPQATSWRRCVRQPEEDVSARDGDTADGAAVDGHDWARAGAGTADADVGSAGGCEGQRGQAGTYRREQGTA